MIKWLPSEMVHTFKPNSLETEAGIFLWVWVQRVQHGELQDSQFHVERSCQNKQTKRKG